MDNDAIKIEALKEALSDPTFNAAVSRFCIDLGALCERMAEGFQRLAREVEKMAEAAEATEPEDAERPVFKVGQRVRIARAMKGWEFWIKEMDAEVGKVGVIADVSNSPMFGGLRVDLDGEVGCYYPPEALDPIDG